MTKIPVYDYDAEPQSPRGIVVHPLRWDAKPIGFAPWPDEPKPKKPKRKKRKP